MSSWKRLWLRSILLLLCLCAAGCVTSPPKRIQNICDIFDEKNGWYKDASKASKKWDSPIPVMMAIMYQESRFQPKAKPPRTKILWLIPGPRKSNAYGFSQAKKETWAWYKKEAGSWGADRDDFGDAIDFIGWYNDKSRQRNKIKSDDAYALYLAYHEGHGGYARGSFRKKAWLRKVAQKVSRRSAIYASQLSSCEHRLSKGGWFF